MVWRSSNCRVIDRPKVFDAYLTKTGFTMLLEPQHVQCVYGLTKVYRVRARPKVHRIGGTVQGMDWYQYTITSVEQKRTWINEQQFPNHAAFLKDMAMWNRMMPDRWRYAEIII